MSAIAVAVLATTALIAAGQQKVEAEPREAKEPEVICIEAEEDPVEEVPVEESEIQRSTEEERKEILEEKKLARNTQEWETVYITKLQPLTEEEIANWNYYGYVPGEGLRFPEIFDLCQQMQSEYGISATMLYAIIEHESMFDPGAVNGRCLGLCQVSDRWHQERMTKAGVTDLFDPAGNIRVASDYLQELFQESERKGYGDDAYYVLMRYNMETETAESLYAQGKISFYASDIMKESDLIQRALENEV